MVISRTRQVVVVFFFAKANNIKQTNYVGESLKSVNHDSVVELLKY